MSISQSDEKRALTKEEFGIVEKTRYPMIAEMDRKGLIELLKQLREYRSKARDQAFRQRREIRGKAEPRGRVPRSNDSQTFKKQIFANAIKRANLKLHTLEKNDRFAEQIHASKRALERKQAAEAERTNGGRPSPGHYRNRGMRAIENPKGTVEIRGAERGRVSQFVRDAQAKRDNAGEARA